MARVDEFGHHNDGSRYVSRSTFALQKLRPILGILQLRIYALYTKNRILLTVVLLFFLGSTTSSAVIMGMILSTFEGNSILTPYCVPHLT